MNVGKKEIRQGEVVVTVDDHIPSEDFFIGKNPDSIRLTGLQLDEEFATSLLPQFLSIWGYKQPLKDDTALHTQVLLNQLLHSPWLHAVFCQLLHALMRIFFSNSRLDHGDSDVSPD